MVKLLNQFKISQQKEFRSIVPAILFLLLFILLFFGEYIIGFVVRYDRGYNLLTYRVVVWDFLATLYALLEGVICVLAAGVYMRLKRGMIVDNPVNRDKSDRGKPSYSIGIMIVVFVLVFCFFEFSAITTALNNQFSSSGILHMARFYRIVMGWLWTAFEAIVAIILTKILLLQNRSEIKPYARY